MVVVDAGVAADLTALSSNPSFINKKIAFGTGNMAKGPAIGMEQARAGIRNWN